MHIVCFLKSVELLVDLFPRRQQSLHVVHNDVGLNPQNPRTVCKQNNKKIQNGF